MSILSKLLSASFHRSFLAVCLVFFSFAVTAADDFPEKATRLVTDYTGTLRPDELQSLENKLVAFDDTTSMQIAVVMMGSVGNYDISDYTVQLFNKWKIGDKKNNSGVLLLVAKDDRKVWITTGYGMEGVFPDALVKQVIDREIVPKFRSGDYFGGIDAGTTAITSIVKGEYKATKKKKDGGGIFPFLMMLFIIFVIFISQINRTRRYGRKNNLGFWAAWALLNAASNRSRGSWGGFSGGSGFGGGGGGFGGFGGGSSGGGGAGGSW